MTPPDAQAGVDAALLQRIRPWCEGGAFPKMAEPLRIARIAPQPGLDGVACELDGSHELARLGRWRGLAWRVLLLLRECLTATAARAQDPWDCGWWREGALGAAESFRPRRATLLLVRETDAASLDALLSTLQVQSPSYEQPLRVLIVSAGALPSAPHAPIVAL